MLMRYIFPVSKTDVWRVPRCIFDSTMKGNAQQLHLPWRLLLQTRYSQQLNISYTRIYLFPCFTSPYENRKEGIPGYRACSTPECMAGIAESGNHMHIHSSVPWLSACTWMDPSALVCGNEKLYYVESLYLLLTRFSELVPLWRFLDICSRLCHIKQQSIEWQLVVLVPLLSHYLPLHGCIRGSDKSNRKLWYNACPLMWRPSLITIWPPYDRIF